MVTFALKVNLRSNVKERSVANSVVDHSISQFSILGGFICCVKSLEVEQSKVLVMGCHWHSGLITVLDNGITLVGVRVSA
ncbi:MAG: hypothetical protein JXQ86_00280 [Methylophilaceae bacterium]